MENFKAVDGTNIYEGLRVGIVLAKRYQAKKKENNIMSLILFLTDGIPETGLTKNEDILDEIMKINDIHVPIYTLGFGDDANQTFLDELSYKNGGFSKHIYVKKDTSLQLEGFYSMISSPLLTNISFDYSNQLKNVTKNKFSNYFNGSEIVISGILSKNFTIFYFYLDFLKNPFFTEAREFTNVPKINCQSAEGPKIYAPNQEEALVELQKLWVYLTLQEHFEQKGMMTKDEAIALDLAIKHSFLTPLTSMVMQKPKGHSTVNIEPADTTSLYFFLFNLLFCFYLYV